MKIVVDGDPKEIAALILAVQGRQVAGEIHLHDEFSAMTQVLAATIHGKRAEEEPSLENL